MFLGHNIDVIVNLFSLREIGLCVVNVFGVFYMDAALAVLYVDHLTADH